MKFQFNIFQVSPFLYLVLFNEMLNHFFLKINSLENEFIVSQEHLSESAMNSPHQ